MGPKICGAAIADILQHRRVLGLGVNATGEIRYSIYLREGEAVQPLEDLPPGLESTDFLRRIPRMEEISALEQRAVFNACRLYAHAAQNWLVPLAWVAVRAPKQASPARPHPLERADFDFLGYPGYLGDVNAGSLFLLCGTERGEGAMSATACFKMQLPKNQEEELWPTSVE